MSAKKVSAQLEEYRPDMGKTNVVSLADIFGKKLTTGRTIDPNRNDIDVLYEQRVMYLAMHPEDISLSELAKATQSKEKGELSAGEEFCRMVGEANAIPITIIESGDKK